jgi:hypothetical protein
VVVKQRLPAFRFPYVPEASLKEFSTFVIAGLDPAIHAARKLPLSFRSRNSAWTTGSSAVVTREGAV